MGIFTNWMSRKQKGRGKKHRQPLLSDHVQTFIAHRLTDTAAAAFIAVAAAVFLMLGTYHAADPSFNTTLNGGDVKNALGTFGAYGADVLLQTLGIAAWLIGVAAAVWGYRIFRRLPVGALSARIPALVVAVLAAAICFAHVPAFDSWGLGAYLGGSAGALVFKAIGGPLQSWLGATAYTFIAIVAGVAFIASFAVCLGISRGEWAAFLMATHARIRAVFNAITAAVARFTDWHSTYAGRTSVRDTVAVRPRRIAVTADTDTAENDSTDTVATAPLTDDRPKPVIAPRAAAPKPAARAEKQASLPLRANDDEWILPEMDFLTDPPPAALNQRLDEAALQKNAALLQSTLNDFGVQGDILKVNPGPVITLYEMEPAPGTKTSRVIGLSDDIARSMSAVSVRVSVVPGKNAIGMELPNAKRETVYLRELLSSRDYDKTAAKLPLTLGKNIAGAPVIADLARMPHLLVAGTTGSGKSVGVNAMILSLLYKLSPEQCRFIMIDPKMLELSVYDDIPHLLTPVVTEPHRAVTALKWATREMEDRYRAMSKLGVRNIDGFNQRVREARQTGEVLTHRVQTGFDADTGRPVYEEQPIPMADLPYIVIIVDEFADLMLVAGKEVENAIQRLAQMARAAGIHLIMATQRPSVDVITGVIKANFPTRISFQVTSKIDSRTILGEGGAEHLLGMGDMLYMASGGRLTRVHAPFVSDGEIEKIVKFLKQQGTPQYVDSVTEDQEEQGGMFGGGDEGGGDELYDHAVALVLRERKVSTSFVQRHMQIGYNRAARLVERMEREGLISSANHVGKREILVDNYGT